MYRNEGYGFCDEIEGKVGQCQIIYNIRADLVVRYQYGGRRVQAVVWA